MGLEGGRGGPPPVVSINKFLVGCIFFATLLGKESLLLVAMPPSRSQKWFITVSPRVYEEIDQKVVASRSMVYAEYHVIKEYGSNGDHPHIHAYVSGKQEESQEQVRRRWMSCLPKDTTDYKIALKVVKCTDRDQLIGAYLQKDAKCEVLYSNMSDEELSRLRDEYAHINKAKSKPSKWKKPSLESMTDEMLNYVKVHELPLKTHADFKDVVRHMMKNGYMLVNIQNRLKYVWCQIASIVGEYDDLSHLD